jgi:hypothetical protein
LLCEPVANEQQQQQQDQHQHQPQGQQEDVYYYNPATNSIAWSLPPELQQLVSAAGATRTTGAAGSTGATGASSAQASADGLGVALSPAAYQALLNLQDERVLPSISAIKGGESVLSRGATCSAAIVPCAVCMHTAIYQCHQGR